MGTRTGFKDGRETPTPLDRPKGGLREYIEIILTCVLFIVFARGFVFQQSEIPSGSMEDTILVGDYILVNRFVYAPTSFDWERRLLPIRELRRGEIVVFKNPEEPERDFIKRIAGVPGDRVRMRGGTLYVNDRAVEEPYVNPLYRRGDFGPEIVRPGHYFLLGDHRNRSKDSRSWGQAPRELIKGQAFMILFSTSAPPPADQPAEQVTLRSLLRKLYNLVFHSRWDRAFRSIS